MPAPLIGESSITQTTAIALSTSSSGAVLIWIIRMFEDGHIETPSAEIAMTLMAFFMPFIHAVSRVILRWLEPDQPNQNGAVQ